MPTTSVTTEKMRQIYYIQKAQNKPLRYQTTRSNYLCATTQAILWKWYEELIL